MSSQNIVSFAHQKECFELSKDKHFFALLMEMGTGKTRVVLQTAEYLFKNKEINGLLVLAPKSITRNWTEKEIPTHFSEDIRKKIVLWRNNSKVLEKELYSVRKSDPFQLHVFVMNPEAITTDRGYDAAMHFLESHETLMIIDESTTIKNWRAERTKIAIRLGQKAKYRRIMTGTPVTQSPLDIYSQFDFLKHGSLGSTNFYGFRNTYAVLKKRYVNGRSFDEIVGYQRLEKLQKLLQSISYRKLKSECLDLPPKIYQIRYVELDIDQKRYYNQIKEEAMAMLNSGEVVTAPLIITQLLRLRQSLCNLTAIDGTSQFISDKNPRINEIIDILEESGEQKVIIWSNFVDSIKAIHDAISKKYGANIVGCIHGDVDAATRQSYVERFQGEKIVNDKLEKISKEEQIKYLVMQPRTAGYGLTLTAGNLVIYCDHDWSLEVRQQSEDRCHRIGQKNSVTYIDLVAKGTIDEKIRAALVEKKDIAGLVTGDKLKELLMEEVINGPNGSIRLK